jgi:hypothetical protein
MRHPIKTWCYPGRLDGEQFEALQDLETLSVRTRNSTYEIIVLRSSTGDVLVRGGPFFPEYTHARLAGSSLGGSFLKWHGVYVGFSMELQHDRQTILTTRVRSLERKSDHLVLKSAPFVVPILGTKQT